MANLANELTVATITDGYTIQLAAVISYSGHILPLFVAVFVEYEFSRWSRLTHCTFNYKGSIYFLFYRLQTLSIGFCRLQPVIYTEL